MVAHRIVALGFAALLTTMPVTASTPSPRGTPSSVTPPYVPCPITQQAAAVAVPRSTLPPPEPRPTGWRVIGGAGLGTAGLTLPKDAPALPGNLAARSWLIADLGTGAVLAACGPHERHPPASVQKLLLAATVLPRLDPNQVVEVTREDLDIEPGSSAVGLITGGRYSVQTLWLGLLLVSGNDAANALARLGGGADGVAGTMRDANDLAYRLGARDTHAVTPHGLDAPGQFTSAYDLALIARECLGREDFRRYTATPNTKIPPQPPKDPRGFQIQNDNPLMVNYQGALGGKTGFTDAARHTYVGAAERGGRRLVVTLLDGEVVPQRSWQQAAALLEWGFSIPESAGVGRLVSQGDLDAPPSASATASGAPGDGLIAAPTGGHGTTVRDAGMIAAVVAIVAVAAGASGFAVRRRRRTFQPARRRGGARRRDERRPRAAPRDRDDRW